MDFSPSARCQELMALMRAFLDEVVYPAAAGFSPAGGGEPGGG